MTKKIILAAVYFFFIDKVSSQLFPIDPEKQENIYDIQIPTTRQSLDDCATRYYRYGRNNLASPVLGTPVELSEFAHFAAIGWTNDDSIDWDCGGSLISDNFVLGAGHCTVSRRGQEPDKVLLGDRRPYSTEDDEFAQLFNIVEIIKHENYRYSSHYNDIALFRLSGNIKPHKTVLPACLWSVDNFLDFKELEGIGIGARGFYENKTDKLEKVTLNPIDLETCKEFYQPAFKLRQGLVEHQICARDNKRDGLRQDLCGGDSGGPLQVKLLANGRITSFIVGVTSFGAGCGNDAPGVYASVASFVSWIEKKVGISFEPRKCALRYVSLREFQPGLLELADRTGNDDKDLTLQDYRSNWINSKIHIARDYRHKAYLGWYTSDDNIHWYCGASLISERWLLTAAHCMSKRPDIASVGGLRPHSNAENHLNQKREIEEIVIHPSYRSNEVQADIALVKLKEDVKLSLDTVPACIWKKPELPTDTYEIVGWGSRTSNLFFIDLPVWQVDNDEVFPIVTSECDAQCQVNKTKPLETIVDHSTKDEIRYLEVNSTVLSNAACKEYYSKKNGYKITDNHLCIQNDLFAVPGICNMDVGGPVERKIWAYNEYDSYVFGVNSFGKNCGFGTPVVATRVSSFADWIEEHVLGVTGFASSSKMVFIDDHQNKTEGDTCLIPGEKDSGVCVEASECVKHLSNLRKRNEQLNVCGFEPSVTVCCPSHATSRIGGGKTDLHQCSKLYKEFRQTSRGVEGAEKYENNKVFTHTAAIGFANQRGIDYKCWGALISEDFVVTTASCLAQSRTNPKQVRLGNVNFGLSNEEQLKAVSKVIVHPLYNPYGYYNDIALLKLVTAARLTRNVIPACLWHSEDFVPFIGIVPGPSSTRDIVYNCTRSGDKKCEATNEKDSERKLLTLQNDDCERFYKPSTVLPGGVISSQMCAQAEGFNSSDACIRTPGALYQKSIEENGVVVPFIVGLYSYNEDCDKDNPAIFTRVSSFMTFITEQIDLENESDSFRFKPQKIQKIHKTIHY